MTLSLIFASYLVGRILFALWLTRCSKRTDVRRIGSGNVGSINVWRVADTSTGLAVLALDVGKGLALVLCVREFGATVSVLAAAAVVGGHVFQIRLRSKEGKDVAMSAGAFSILTPWPCSSRLVYSLQWSA